MTTRMLLFKSWWSPAHGGTHIKRVYRMPAHGHGESGGSSRNLGQSFWELANLAISSSNQNKIVDIAPVPDWEVREAKDQAQLDIAGFHHVADMYAIRHAINQHGNSQKEAARGQIAITTQDIIAIPDAVLRPDAVVYGFKNNRGQDMVASIKRQTDGTLLVVKEVRTGRKALAMASMRKLPAAKDFDSVVRTLLSNARSDGGSDLKIVEHAEFSNSLHKGNPMNPIALLFKSLVPSHTRRLKTGKVIRVRQYSNKVTKRPDDDGTLDMFGDSGNDPGLFDEPAKPEPSELSFTDLLNMGDMKGAADKLRGMSYYEAIETAAKAGFSIFSIPHGKRRDGAAVATMLADQITRAAKLKTDGYGLRGKAKPDTITEPRKDLIDEHKRLVDVLNSPSHKDDKAEAKRQEKELEGYQKKQPSTPKDDDPESALRASRTEQGVPKARQDELIAQIAGKAKPGAKVGPFTIGGAKEEDENNHMIAHMARSMAGGAGKLGDMIAQLGKTANKDWQYEKALDDPAFARAYQQHYLDAWAVSDGIKRLDEKYPRLKIMEKIAGPEAMRLISDYASHRYYEPDKQTLQNLIGDSKPHLKTLKTKTPKVTSIKEVDGR